MATKGASNATEADIRNKLKYLVGKVRLRGGRASKHAAG
jgi:hypothetical protein